MKQLLLNRAQCNHCKDIITSYYGHDFKSCKCGKISIDGGHEYGRMLFTHPTDFTNLSVYDDGKHETRRSNMHWGRNYDKDMNCLLKIGYIFIKDMDTDYIEVVLRMFNTQLSKIYNETFNNELKYRENEIRKAIVWDLEECLNGK